jgi:UDP-N-acetylmuramyl tripeptide synthase
MTLIALIVGKAVTFLLRLLGRKGTYLSGKIALKLCPGFIAKVKKPAKVLAVTGTNGKTTVNNLISDALEASGRRVLSNRYGSNIAAGVASALIEGSTLTGKPKFDVAVLECDERSARLIFPGLKPDVILITNIFRDSMRRNAHPEYIADFLASGIPDGTELLLNADDLISCGIKPACPRTYFSFDPQPFEREPWDNIVMDVRLCPECGEHLEWDFRRYNHIGRAHCPKCGFTSPRADFRLVSADPETLRGTADFAGEIIELPLHGTAVYNMYNSLAAAAALVKLGLAPAEAAQALEKVAIVGSRFTDETHGGKKLTMIMAKGLNAVACSRSFDFVNAADGRNTVVLMLDDVFDQKESSENIAWLYDADFELLAGENVARIVPVGVRRFDSRLRLLLAGVDDKKIKPAEGLSEAAAAVEPAECDRVFLLYELYREADARKLYAMLADRLEEAAK